MCGACKVSNLVGPEVNWADASVRNKNNLKAFKKLLGSHQEIINGG